MKKKIFKYISITSTAILVLMLITATVAEKYHGSKYALENIYTAPFGIVLWAVTAVSGIIYFFTGNRKPLFTICIHLSFILILIGALLTHITGMQGCVRLRKDVKESNIFFLPDGSIGRFPFRIALEEFDIEHYPGTATPADYVSKIKIFDNGGKTEGIISMNNIFSYKGYRFYQSSFDEDLNGTTLSIAYDPYGIAVTYTGYAMLIVSLIGFFFQKGSMYRALLRRWKSTAILLLLLLPATASAQTTPEVLPKDIAEEFCGLYTLYNGRIAPMQTLAKDFTVKLYGKNSYKGYSAEQVLTGWIFFFDSWKEEAVIKIKDDKIGNALGIDGEYASLSDFYDSNGRQKIVMQFNGDGIPQRSVLEANEKFSLAVMAGNGTIIKIYPLHEKNSSSLQWHSLSGELPSDTPCEQSVFIQYSRNFLAEQIALKNYGAVKEIIDKIKEYQIKEGGNLLPSANRFRAEKIYNKLDCDIPLAIILVCAGLLFTIIYCLRVAKSMQDPQKQNRYLIPLTAIATLYLTASLSLRWYISGHVPLANGFEVMQFMALCSALSGISLARRITIAPPLCTLLCGLVLMVAGMGGGNPAVTQLMPVLQSPLLSIHVAVIMIAYAVFTFCMLIGITAIALRAGNKECHEEVSRLADISLIMLYPAIFLLATGIFIGAVWANISWGRYWGWDPKEVWALITMLIYSTLLHRTTFKWLRNPMAIHIFCIAAFLSVLITYFGVNLFLGGMHSYA